MKQKAFSWRDRFAAKDAAGNDRWYAEGEPFSWTRTLHVYDANGNEAAQVRRKSWFSIRKYVIACGGQEFTLVQEIAFFKCRYHLEGLPWTMVGDVWAHDFELTDGERPQMRVNKAWFTWGDSYAIEIANQQNELLCLCIVLAVDCMEADRNTAAAST